MHGPRILVVEDDPDIRRILKDNLELGGYNVCATSTGREALSLVEDYRPAAILLDLSLPDIDGIQVCRLIRQKSMVPIVMLTARDRSMDKVLAREAGANRYVVKPFAAAELTESIKGLVEDR